MFRIILFLLVVVAVAAGFSWLADRPGEIIINWEDRVIETTVFGAVIVGAIALASLMFLWSLMSSIFSTPAAVGNFVNRRRQTKGMEALSTGMIAIGAGDQAAATRYALQARRSLPNEPMTHLLRAQAAQLSGDKATSRRIFEAMLATPDTEQLGLRGLYLEAEREKEVVAARHFAERAVTLNPKLGWAVDALFSLQCKSSDWAGALETVAIARKNGHIEKATANRRRAVLLTAQAQALEEGDQAKALRLATEAHGLAPDLVPAGAIAGRILAARGSTPKATKIIGKTWSKSPHPDLATAYAYARLGDSPRDRLERVKRLTAGNPYSLEAPIAVATAAIEARAFDEARNALKPLLDDRLTQRVCTLMARIESEDTGNTGAVREWLARAVTAPRDPAWTADGVVSNSWAPISPVTGALDAFQWRVPVDAPEKSDNDMLMQKLEEFVALGATGKTIEALEIPATTTNTTATTTNPTNTNAPAKTEKPAATPPASDTAAKTESVASTADAPKTKNKFATAANVTAATVSVVPKEDGVDTQVEPVAERARTTPAQPTPRLAQETTAQSNGNGAGSPLIVDIQKDTKPVEAAKQNSGAGTTGKNARFFESPPAPDDPGTRIAEKPVKRDPANPYRRVTS